MAFMSAATLVWFRQDLRLRDNSALHAACARGSPVMPVFIWAPEEEGAWPPGSASRWWLHQSLRSLDEALRQHGLRLIVRRGPALEVLRTLLAETGAGAVYWNRRYEPAAQDCSRRVKAALRRDGIVARGFNSALLCEPTELLNQGGKPYQVYTPFMRRLLQSVNPPPALPVPQALRAPLHWPVSMGIDALALMPRVPWFASLAACWQPGESGADARLQNFLNTRFHNYEDARDLPAAAGTSGLSPHLHFGEIGPRQIWHTLGAQRRGSRPGAMFLRELVWREFGYHLLHHFPHTADAPLREEFAHFPWRQDLAGLSSWQTGETGIPMVDAGMRELWATGVMHNRVRMIAASFLVKNLLLPWQHGARWFWDTLVDADLASNTLNWQWVAGCGADAAPYFRIFNPVLQGQRFDPQGQYLRRWIAALANVPHKHVHAPWLAENRPQDYPLPMVDLPASRQAALDAYQSMRNQMDAPL
jgi:deoxyribodipyrimidine photo-lyase